MTSETRVEIANQDVQSTERERIAKLDELALLDEPAHPQFERICEVAAAMFGVPYAFVSLVDATEAHVFAHRGLAPGHMPRELAMCNVPVTNGSPLVVPELTRDPRFAGTPLVTGAVAMRFYAGIPIEVAPGVRLGALCIADRQGRDLSGDELAALRSLSSMVVEQIDHHARRQRLVRLASQLAGRQAILAQTESLAKVGGFELDLADDGMTWSDGLGLLLRVAPGAAASLGTFLSCFAAPAPVAEAFKRIAIGAPLDLEARLNDESDPRIVHMHAERLEMGDGAVKIAGIVQDVTERKKATAALEWSASHDPLTGLLNRAAFTLAVETAMRGARDDGDRVALVMIDIDRFKMVNDTLGHDVGDVVLQAVAERMKVAAGRWTVGRIGGDEFAVLLAGYAAEGTVAALATRLLMELRLPLLHQVSVLGTRATLGVVLREPGIDDAVDLFKAADLALYHAKDAGRDGFAFFQPRMRATHVRRQGRLADARAAIGDGRIEAFYQPKIVLDSGRVAGFEALLRWHHPERGLCLPGEIAEAFDEPTVAIDLGKTIARRVAQDMVGWREAGVPFGHVALNVSEAQLCSDRYAERLLASLARRGLAPDMLELEVTESVLLGQSSGHVARQLRALADAGIAIALDDFGTGYASLVHLKRHPVSAIKIDRSFVTDIEHDLQDATIVDAMTSLANSLGLTVVAEGIETASQAQYLRGRSCTMGQGFLFAKPMPASRVPHFLKAWNSRVSRLPRATAEELPRARLQA